MIVKNLDEVIKTYSDLKKNFKVRSSVNFSELITSSGSKIICNQNNKFQKGLYLFAMVKRDILLYIKEYGVITPFDELPVNCINEKFSKKKKIVGMDINNAYWSIANLKGYIRENTYNKGLSNPDFKPVRLSALSSLGKPKVYKVYEDGEYTKNELLKGNKELENFYLDIRFSTYGVMREIALKLGEDFQSWKTDCIFFYDTKENRKLVKTMFEDYGLECKIEKKG